MKYRKIIISWLAIVALLLALSGCGIESTPLNNTGSIGSYFADDLSDNSSEMTDASSFPAGSEALTSSQTSPSSSVIQQSQSENAQTDKAPTVSVDKIPAYSGKPYVAINDNIPIFSSAELTTKGYESYAELDHLGRTSVAVASIGEETMPADGEKRASITAVKPSGWVQKSYDNISGKYLYNRCHLIGWQLSAENANKKNLITGTKYLNINGMLPFENMVADYIRETGNHVAYRITPMYDGDNLLASGVRMEAYSIEDDGEGICFHVYCYNVQPDIIIDYRTGDSSAFSGGSATTSSRVTVSSQTTTTSRVTQTNDNQPVNGQTVYRTPSGKRYHLDQDCGGKNSYSVTLDQATSAGLTPCQKCAQ